MHAWPNSLSGGQQQRVAILLNGISCDIPAQEVLCVIGPSGSGKSTFLRCLNGLESIDGGRVVVNGFEVQDPKIRINTLRQHVGMPASPIWRMLPVRFQAPMRLTGSPIW
ncbi:hypothetical protein CRX72_20610 [Pantoea sp. BRM17]|nr:hypothetical protein CRX72_20610 [Pantoea sp. BRM17]